jgi:hypothetical protein
MKMKMKLFLLSALLVLIGAAQGSAVGSACYQVNGTPCSPNGSTRTCVLGGSTLPCHCFIGRWNCPVEP